MSKNPNKIIILGLGNPDKQYQNNRHNVGHLFLNWLQKEGNFPPFKENKKVQAMITTFSYQDQIIILAKSLNFMNESYKTFSALKKYFQAEEKDFIVVHDDTDLLIGQYKIQFSRGAAGHRGVLSIINHFGKNFYRIRIGVRPKQESRRRKADELVLRNFTKEEKEELNLIFPKIAEQLNISKLIEH